MIATLLLGAAIGAAITGLPLGLFCLLLRSRADAADEEATCLCRHLLVATTKITRLEGQLITAGIRPLPEDIIT